MRPTLLDTMTRGFRASVTLDNINLSNQYDGGIGRKPAGGGSIDLVGRKHATYEALYRTQPWVHSIVNRLARGIGRLPLSAYSGPDQDDERERLRAGPLADLMAEGYEGGNPSLLKQGIMMNLLIHGNAIVVKHRPGFGRPPDELIPSSFAYWDLVPSLERAGQIDWYLYHNVAGQVIPFLPDEIIHFHPWGIGRGTFATSPLEALRTTLMIEDASQRAVIAAYENGMRPVGAYSIEGTYKDKPAAERARAQLNATYGGVDNAFKILLLEGGAKWQDMTHNFVDAELANIRKIAREEVAAVYNIPQPSVGMLDHATFSNITEQHLMEYMDSYSPWTVLIEETLQAQLIDQEPTMADQYVEFNYKEVLKGDPIKELESGVKVTGGPFMSVNEYRRTQNLPKTSNPKDDEIREAPNLSAAAAVADGGPAPA